MEAFSPETCHQPLLAAAPRRLAFDPSSDYATWRTAVDEKLRELVGELPEPVVPNLRIEYVRDEGDYTETRFIFSAEANADVPCHLLVPKAGTAPYPVVICLQGHSTGMHISLGRAKYDGDDAVIAGGRDFGQQAVREGYAALVLEQRCFGERNDVRPQEVRHVGGGCSHASMVALLLGRTMIGERVWDVSRAIDVLAHFPQLDLTRIGCMGNSGGGTITFFAACLEPRITAAMPSCYVCTFRDSIGSIDHCQDNYLPGVLRFFEMGDLACLIAPRPLVVVAGREDPIFPLAAVEETFATIQAIYQAAGAPENCRLVVGDSGHRFYPEIGWPAFNALTGWSGGVRIAE
ncbi:MAG: alpha/beta hydrolase family protein [Armatimonadota bacterium]